MLGVTVYEARALRDGDLSVFSDGGQAAILLMEAVEDHAMSDAIWHAAARHFTQAELLVLVMIAGFYGYVSWITLALDVAVDEGLRRIAKS
jgi:heme/copper-type cytochrome/quinol oxidase subunit 1